MMSKRSSTTLHQNRKPAIQNQRESTPNLQIHKKPSTSLLKNRSHSSFKITVTKNQVGNNSVAPADKKPSRLKVSPAMEISLKKKQSKDHSSMKKDKTSSLSKLSKPESPLKHKSFQNNSNQRKTPTSLLTNRSNKPIPEQIMEYVKKREDVEIVEYFQQYKKQFYTKSKVLQTFIYESDEPQKIKNTYLNEMDTHFRNGLEANMLKLFRSGVIVPQSYTNLRQQAVTQIQKWVIGWIHRKMSYNNYVEEEEAQIETVEKTIKELEDYKRMIDTEDTSF